MFVTVSKKSIIVVAAVAILFAVLCAGVGVTSSAQVFFGESTRKVPVYSVETDEKVIALTFDAAWGADKTLGIIDILNDYNAHATFFLVGFWIDKYQDEVKAIADAGLDIGNHSENHLNMPRLAKNKMREEIFSVNEKIFALTGQTPKYFRAPYGDYDNSLMIVLDEMNMTGVQWSIDTLDWKGLSAAQISERVLPKAKSGDIVLFHNNSDHVLDALPIVLEGLKQKGFKFVALSEMVATENYYTDSQGVQHKQN